MNLKDLHRGLISILIRWSHHLAVVVDHLLNLIRCLKVSVTPNRDRCWISVSAQLLS